ncbi:MAG: endonuclease/exonuclease/phosphatase family protein [Ardenticatenaceae bacterium]|nr:endonuclease/exonuclease/phosphatase family protein [Ardenticatenaceae bacterium]
MNRVQQRTGVMMGVGKRPLRFTALLWGALWLIVVLLAELALCRLFFYDRTEIFIWANVMTPYLYLPAYAILLLAVVRRRWGLAGVSGLIVAAHLVWLAPNLAQAEALAPTAATAPSLRLFSANLFARNEQYAAMIAEIEAADPDVLLLQEYTPVWHAALSDAGLFAAYPYSITNIYPSPFGAAIWSKLPLQDGEVWEAGGVQMLRATLVFNEQAIRLYNVHPSPPLFALDTWNGQLGGLAAALAAETGPVVAIGDFNVTPQNYWYQELTNGRLRDAHLDRGRGLAVTWPNGYNYVPPVRLDHALLSPELICLDIQEGLGKGSDHKPLIVDIALQT